MQVLPFIDVAKFTTDIDAHQDDIQEAMRTQTSLTAYYGIQHAAAEKQLNRMKLVEKTMLASLGKEVRTDMLASGEKPSAASIDERVSVMAQVKTMALAIIDAQEIERVCKVAYDAFRTRRDMLVSLGNLQRATMQTGLTIRNAKDEVAGYHERRAGRSEGYRARREAAAAQGD